MWSRWVARRRTLEKCQLQSLQVESISKEIHRDTYLGFTLSTGEASRFQYRQRKLLLVTTQCY